MTGQTTKIYKNPWLYEGKPFTSDMIGDNIGFIYVITDQSNGLKYIGKKTLQSKRKLPPLKGMKRKRTKIVETDWKTYYGSSEEVKKNIAEKGEENFQREIIKLCKSKGQMSYYEAKMQFETDCLLKPTEYYNQFIGVKLHRKHVYTSTQD